MCTHPVYKTPIVPLESFDEFTPQRGDEETIHTIPIGDGMELGVLYGLGWKQSNVLRVGFHAAKTPRNARDHMFSPVTMARKSGFPYLLFSDPTLTISDTNLLSWYVGTPDVNPDDWMERFTRRLMTAIGATRLLIQGSSGGGFTALRFGARFHNAVVVPKSPQTDLFRYQPGPLSATLRDAGWGDYSYEDVLRDHSTRFRVADIYNDPAWNRANIIQYVQNVGDRSHVRDHLNPFLLETGSKSVATFSAVKGRMAVSRPFTGAGHAGIPADYWVAEAKIGLSRLQTLKRRVREEPLFEPPQGLSIPEELAPIRAKNIQQHRPENTTW